MQNAMAYRAKFVQKLAGGDVVVRRARPVRVSEATLLKHLDEIKAKSALGLLEVRTSDGRMLDLNTLKVAGRATVPKPMPDFPADSVARDKPINVHVRPYAEGKAQLEEVEEPVLMREQMPEGEEPSFVEELPPIEEPSSPDKSKKSKGKK
jgi:hypothetical protein